MRYSLLRTIHLICGAFAVPMLVMYGLSAVQMAHSRWFTLRPAVSNRAVAMSPGITDGRAVARESMVRAGISGEIEAIREVPDGVAIRIAVPGTVHEVTYDRATGTAGIRTSTAGVMGMLNRLHHAAGLWHEYFPLRLWAVLVGATSIATLVLVGTGVWMWWKRKEERVWGTVLLVANLASSIAVFVMIRRAGP